MKRALVIVTSCILIMMMSASMCFAANTLEITDTTPKDGATGTSLENLSVKLWFNEPMYSKKYNDANENCFTLTDNKGKEVPIIVKFNGDAKYEKQVLVLVDTSKDYKTKQQTDYTLTINENLVSADGNKLSEKALANNTITFTTINQRRTTAVNMLLMFLIVVVMIVASMRSAKKGNEKDPKKQDQKVNPYKEAKRTGKSVEEIVAKDQKNKAKQAAKEAKEHEQEEKAKEKEEEKAKEKEQEREDAFRKHVSAPRPISAAGSTYKTGRKAEAEKKAKEEAAKKAKGTTNPKNKGGKNNKNKKKKKK